MAGPSEFDRGHEAGEIAGKIDARLAGHDRHFLDINGSIAKVGAELHVINLTVQRLADQAIARDATAIALAAALKEASEKRWSPFARLWLVVGAVAAVAGIAAFLMR